MQRASNTWQIQGFLAFYNVGQIQNILELKDKGLDENHSQSKYSIFHHVFNSQHYQILLINPLRQPSTNLLRQTTQRINGFVAKDLSMVVVKDLSILSGSVDY